MRTVSPCPVLAFWCVAAVIWGALAPLRADGRSPVEDRIEKLRRIEEAGPAQAKGFLAEMKGLRKEAKDGGKEARAVLARFLAGGVRWALADRPGTVCALAAWERDLFAGWCVREGEPKIWVAKFNLADGAERWSRRDEPLPEKSIQLAAGPWGGVAWGSRAAVLYAGPDGAKVWEKGLPGQLGRLRVAGDRLLVGGSGGRGKGQGWLTLAAAADGAEAWAREPDHVPGMVGEMHLLPGGLLASGDQLLDWKGWMKLYAVSDGGPIWERTGLPGRIVLVSPNADGTSVFASGVGGGDENGEGRVFWLGVYEAKTGKTVWEKPPTPPPGGASAVAWTASGVAAGGIIPGTFTGWLSLYHAETGAPRWCKTADTLPGTVSALSATEHGLLVSGLAGKESSWVGLYDLSSGRPIWEKRGDALPGTVSGARRSDRGILVWGRKSTDEGWMDCYDPASGKTLWEERQGILPGPAVHVGVVPEGVVAGGRMAGKRPGTAGAGWIGLIRLADADAGPGNVKGQ